MNITHVRSGTFEHNGLFHLINIHPLQMMKMSVPGPGGPNLMRSVCPRGPKPNEKRLSQGAQT